MARGFTLIEFIVVIILLGIMGTYVFNFVGYSAQIYSDAGAREQLISQSRFAIERLTLELRNALPRSVRVSSDQHQQCLEFMPIITSSQYLEIPRTTTDNGPLHGVAPAIPPGISLVDQYLLVAAVNDSYIYGSADQRRKTITAVTPGPTNHEIIIEFEGTPHHFTGTSPAQRYYVIAPPVSWCYQPNTQQLWRFSHYGINPTAPTFISLQSSFDAQGEVMAQGMTNDLTVPNAQWPFVVDEATLVRSSLIQLDWRFTHARTGESIQLLHEVHIANVP